MGDPRGRHQMQIALFQPDIPQNTGTILRLCACLNVAAHIVEPAGFPVSDRHFRRAGMDYLDQVTIMRHDSWSKFEQWRNDKGYRLVLFTTKGVSSYLEYRYHAADILLFGRESAGVPDDVVTACRCAAGSNQKWRRKLISVTTAIIWEPAMKCRRLMERRFKDRCD